MNDFKVCFYATVNTPYIEIARDYVLASLVKLNIPYDYEIVPNLKSWHRNTAYKATFAKRMLTKHKENIVLLDADCKVFQYPELFKFIPEDFNIAAHVLDHNSWYQNGSNKHELLTGTLFLRNNERTHYLVDIWNHLCQTTPDTWEQLILKNVLRDNNEAIYELPLSYCYIDTLPDGAKPFVFCDNPVVVHYQASRVLKRQIV
jgi:hypothetical protein